MVNENANQSPETLRNMGDCVDTKLHPEDKMGAVVLLDKFCFKMTEHRKQEDLEFEVTQKERHTPVIQS